jgi:hypothetical protein
VDDPNSDHDAESVLERRTLWLLVIVTFYLVFSGAVGLLITVLLAMGVVRPAPEVRAVIASTPPLVNLLGVAADGLKLAGGVLLYVRRPECVAYVEGSALATGVLAVYHIQAGTFRELHVSLVSEVVPYTLLGVAVLCVRALRRNGTLQG